VTGGSLECKNSAAVRGKENEEAASLPQSFHLAGDLVNTWHFVNPEKWKTPGICFIQKSGNLIPTAPEMAVRMLLMQQENDW